MTLTESLLPKLSEWTPAGDGRHSWAATFASQGWSVGLTADKMDSLSCLLWELALTRTAEPPVGLTLKSWASSIADRVAGLMEPLSVYEVDETRNEAILRSEAPGRKGDALAYYELRLSGLTSATLRRFMAAKATSGRTQIAFPVTHETLAQVIGHIAG